MTLNPKAVEAIIDAIEENETAYNKIRYIIRKEAVIVFQEIGCPKLCKGIKDCESGKAADNNG